MPERLWNVCCLVEQLDAEEQARDDAEGADKPHYVLMSRALTSRGPTCVPNGEGAKDLLQEEERAQVVDEETGGK